MVLDFPYLDQFIREVLRMYPPVLRIERECNKTVTYDGLTIKKGTLVSIATFPLHYSEEYYDEPEKFNPDRWAPENKDNLNPYAYAPFGLGPRNCIGTRFAMEELKIALCTVLSRVKFVPVEETPVTKQEDTVCPCFPIESLIARMHYRKSWSGTPAWRASSKPFRSSSEPNNVERDEAESTFLGMIDEFIE